MAMHEINIDGTELNIYRDCVDELQMGDKPEKLKKAGQRNL